jgi:Spy/CpxP family protein refolding chaperone
MILSVVLSKECKTKNLIQEVKMKKGLTLIVIFSFFVLSVASSFAQPQQRMARGKRTFDRSHSRILAVLKANQEELDITDEQIGQIQDLVFSFKEKTIKTANENSLSRLELQKLMKDKENLDYAKIKAILNQTSAARTDMFIEGLKLREEISNVLTPEQQEALKAKAKKGIRSRPRKLRDLAYQRSPRLRNRIRR